METNLINTSQCQHRKSKKRSANLSWIGPRSLRPGAISSSGLSVSTIVDTIHSHEKSLLDDASSWEPLLEKLDVFVTVMDKITEVSTVDVLNDMSI